MWRLRPCLAEPPAEVALDQEQLRERRIAFLAIGELARERGDSHYGLPARFAGLAGGFASCGGVDDLLDDRARVGGMLLKPLAHLIAHQAFERLANLRAHQLVLGLAAELRVGQLDRDDRGQAFAHVLPGERDLLALQHAGFLGIVVDRSGQRRAEGRHMRAAIALRDVVRERQDVLVITVVPFEGDIDADAVAHRRDGDRFGKQGALGAVEPLHESADSPLVIELVLHALVMSSVGQHQPDARVEEGELAVAMLELLEIEIDDLEGVGAGEEGDAGALLAFGCRANDLQRRLGLAVAEAHEMLLAVAPDGEVEPFAKRVDDRYANAMESARDLVGVVLRSVLELSAGMELGHDDLGRRHPLLGVDSGRDPAPVVLDRHRTVGIQLNEDPVAMAGERLVDGVVADLEDHVMEARTVIGVADVHAGTLAHGVEALEDLDALGAIGISVAFRGNCHSRDIGISAKKSRARGRVRGAGGRVRAGAHARNAVYRWRPLYVLRNV